MQPGRLRPSARTVFWLGTGPFHATTEVTITLRANERTAVENGAVDFFEKLTGQGQAMTAANRTARVAITGLGVISPIGIGQESFWTSLVGQRSGISYLRAFPNSSLPSRLAAEINGFDARQYISPNQRKFLKIMSRDVQLGVSAAAMAVRDSGLDTAAVAPERLGVEFGAGRISTTPEELAEAVHNCAQAGEPFQFSRWGEDSIGEIGPLWLLKQLPNMAACHVSIAHGAQGPNNTITSRDASALLALDEAAGIIRRGAADCMIVGACGSNIHPVDIAKLSLFESLSRRDDEPSRASRPFEKNRDGTIVGEGAGAVLLESWEHAEARGANIYAEVLAVASGCDGRGHANASRGAGLARAISSALRQADLPPHHLGHINAHGKSTLRDDLVESRAYHMAMGDAATKVPLTAMKSYFGSLDAGSGAVELVGTVLSLRHSLAPPTLNYEVPDPACRLSVVHREPLRLANSCAMTVNRTTMGQSVAAILRSP